MLRVVAFTQHGFDQIPVKDTPRGLSGWEVLVEKWGEQSGKGGGTGAGFPRNRDKRFCRGFGDIPVRVRDLEIDVGLRIFKNGSEIHDCGGFLYTDYRLGRKRGRPRIKKETVKRSPNTVNNRILGGFTGGVTEEI